eukprot:gene23592-biopygen17835
MEHRVGIGSSIGLAESCVFGGARATVCMAKGVSARSQWIPSMVHMGVHKRQAGRVVLLDLLCFPLLLWVGLAIPPLSENSVGRGDGALGATAAGATRTHPGTSQKKR